jgi:hypothetical protein
MFERDVCRQRHENRSAGVPTRASLLRSRKDRRRVLRAPSLTMRTGPRPRLLRVGSKLNRAHEEEAATRDHAESFATAHRWHPCGPDMLCTEEMRPCVWKRGGRMRKVRWVTCDECRCGGV